jgi:hypothetical protein
LIAASRLDAAQGDRRGTGIDDVMLTHKTEIVATRWHGRGVLDPLSILSEIGGLEIAALAGFIVGGAANAYPLSVDGVIALARARRRGRTRPGVAAQVIAGHRSTEPGASAALDHLGTRTAARSRHAPRRRHGRVSRPLPIVQCAARILTDMATLDTLTTSRMILGPALSSRAASIGRRQDNVAAGLLAAFRHRGLARSLGEGGPDFIDPGYHSLATGHPSRNLDPWISGLDSMGALAGRASAGGELLIVEGVMGLFDGAADGTPASTARSRRGPRCPSYSSSIAQR